MKYILFFLAPLFLWGDLSHASISYYAVNCKTGEVLLDFESDKSMIPSSCLKIVTTGAALDLLGPDYQFRTDIFLDGELKNGIVKGNIIIRGGGDPCLGSDRTSQGWEKQIEVWTAALKEKGIKEIQGEIIGDASAWEKALAPASWAWEDLGNYYGAGASALSFNENKTTVTFRPGAHVGAPAKLLSVVPSVPSFHMQNEVTTGPVGSGDQACIYGSEYSMTHYIRGTVPAGVEEFSIKGAIPDPAQLCSELLRESLQKNGVKVLGGKFASNKALELLYTTLSPALSEIVYWTNQKSVNLYAEHLLKAVGQGTMSAGLKKVAQFWRDHGVDLRGMNMMDGSGVSRKNFITARQLVAVLMKMKDSTHFFASLPAVKPGVHAKGGSMSSIRCLTGYKGDHAFAILINHYQDLEQVKRKIDEFLDEIK